ncbi:MAG: hypothetical protein QOG67_378 [Verrucomicrobiota bacterium]
MSRTDTRPALVEVLVASTCLCSSVVGTTTATTCAALQGSKKPIAAMERNPAFVPRLRDYGAAGKLAPPGEDRASSTTPAEKHNWRGGVPRLPESPGIKNCAGNTKSCGAEQI